MDQAYNQALTNGFAGASLILEPTVSRISFDDDLLYRDTYLGGINLGLDFGPYVGLRAFYLRSMEDDELNLDFDNMTVYGGDFRFRLSPVTNGISPFVTLGGGYINLDDDYVGRDGPETAAESQPFASGGGGLSVNLSRSFRLIGTYRALLTSGSDVEDLRSPDQIRTSSQWTAGVVLALGKKAKRPDALFASTAQQELQRQQAQANLEKQLALADQAKRNAEATRQLRQDYELKIYGLQQELEGAYTMADSVKIDSLQSAIAQTTEVVEELEVREADLAKVVQDGEVESNILKQQIESGLSVPAPTTFSAPASPPVNGYLGNNNYQQNNAAPAPANYGNSRIVLTPAEFQNLVEEIFEGLNAGLPPLPPLNAEPRRQVRIEKRMIEQDGKVYEIETEEDIDEENVFMFRSDDGQTRQWTGKPQVRVRTATSAEDTKAKADETAALKADLAALKETIRKMEERQTASEAERKAFEEEVRTSLDQGMGELLQAVQEATEAMKKEAAMTDKERKQQRKEKRKN